MEKFVKHGIKQPYISIKPQKQQLYFLYKLIMNRKMFHYSCTDRILVFFNRISTIFCCCKKRKIKNCCSKRFNSAEKQNRLFTKGKHKLTRDLDIVTLIQRQQMHDVNKQALYNSTERFLLQYQRRNVIESNSDSNQENQKFY